MTAGEQRHGRNQGLWHSFLSELRQHDEQRPSSPARQCLGEGAAVVTLDELRLEVVHRVGHARQLRRRVAGRNDRPNFAVEGHQPGAVTKACGDRGQHQRRVHGVFQPWHTTDPAGHDPSGVKKHEHGLVALRSVRAHDGATGTRGRGPIDATELVIDGVLAEVFELGTAAPSLRGAQPNLQDPRPVDAQLGLLARAEDRKYPQTTRKAPGLLASGQPERTDGPDNELIWGESAAALRCDGRPDCHPCAWRDDEPDPPRAGLQRRGQLIGEGQAQATAGGVADAPHHLTICPEGDGLRKLALDFDRAGGRSEQYIEHRRGEHHPVSDDHGPSGKRGDDGGHGRHHDGQPPGEDGHYRGTGTVARMVSSTPSAVTPSSSTSGRTWTRCRSVALAIAFTSSGVTKARPASQAHAFEACSNIAAPRGDTPSDNDGESRVARASATM